MNQGFPQTLMDFRSCILIQHRSSQNEVDCKRIGNDIKAMVESPVCKPFWGIVHRPEASHHGFERSFLFAIVHVTRQREVTFCDEKEGFLMWQHLVGNLLSRVNVCKTCASAFLLPELQVQNEWEYWIELLWCRGQALTQTSCIVQDSAGSCSDTVDVVG